MQANSSLESTAITKISDFRSSSQERFSLVVSKPSRVDVIPSLSSSSSSSQKKPCEEVLKGNIAVLKKPEHNCIEQRRTHSLSVFSGPHFQADQYQIKPDFHAPYPDKYPPVKSRYYVPHLYPYFQAALQSPSHFEVHSDYKSSDPINFRHSYRLNHAHDTHLHGHTTMHRIRSKDDESMHGSMVIPSKRSFTEYQQPNEPKPTESNLSSLVTDGSQSLEPSVVLPPTRNTSRKWHRAASASSEASTTSSVLEDAALLTAFSKGKEKQVTPEVESILSKDDHLSTSSRSTSSKSVECLTNDSDQEYELEDDVTPPPSRQPVITKGRPKGRPRSKVSSVPESTLSKPSEPTLSKPSEPTLSKPSEPTPVKLSEPTPVKPSEPIPAKPSAVPAPAKSSAVPAPAKPSVVPTPAKPSAMPAAAKPSAMPAAAKSSAVPAPAKSSAVPAPAKSSAVPAPAKSSAVPAPAKPSVVPTPAKPSAVPASSEPSSIVTPSNNNQQTDIQPSKPRRIPDQPTAIERIRRYGKFLYTWRIRQSPDVCCICFGDNEKEPIIGCDNPMCDVRLHTSCYHKTKKTGLKMTRRWICDKCNYLKSLPTSVGIACALCPNTSGVFCMLDPKKYTLPWVHYNCAKTFLGEDGIVFNTSTEYYEAQLDFIPSSNFEQICADCTKPSYAQYGAKIPCHLCDKYYHVTCTEQYHLAFQGEPYECLDHTNTTKKDSGSSRKRRLAVVYHRWVGRRNQHLFEEFGKVPRMLTLDLWKSIDLSKISMGKLTHHYQRSLAIIQNNESYPVENTQYSQWVDYILALFASLYSSYDMERNRSIFTLKGFDVHIGYDFKPTEGNTSPTVPSHTALSILTSKNKSQKPKQHTPAAVIPSDDLICAICLQHDLPAQVWERHHLDDDYKAKLISTTGQRKPGYTGTGSYWDPQVFIRCCRCETIVHCGCPQPPIKAYPQKFRVFICIKCDIKHEQAARNQLKSTARRSHQVNYKE